MGFQGCLEDGLFLFVRREMHIGILGFWQWLMYREAIGVSTFLLGNTQTIDFRKKHPTNLGPPNCTIWVSESQGFPSWIQQKHLLVRKKEVPNVDPGSPYQRFEKAVRLEEATHVTQAGQYFFKFSAGQKDYYCILWFPKNRGTPNSSILVGFSLLNHLFWGTTIPGNRHMCMYILFV